MTPVIDLFSSDPLVVAQNNRDAFRADFLEFMECNRHVWDAFEREANRIWSRGRNHYSARTIWEVLRHESALREEGGEYKLNDKTCPDMARLYILLHPDRAGFFELRESPQRRQAA